MSETFKTINKSKSEIGESGKRGVMKNYINKNGEVTKVEPAGVIEIDDCFTGKINKEYIVIVLNDKECFMGKEIFYAEPTDGNILWAIAKHSGFKADIRILYVPEICL